jgi:FemAB-related protein (PEP-CTERM system-associated)
MVSDAEADRATVLISIAEITDGAAWDRYVDQHPDRTLAHRWGWREVLTASFRVQPFYLIARQDDRIVGVLPAALQASRLFGRFMISLPWLDYGGPLADSPETARVLTERLSAIAAEGGCRFVEMRAVRSPLPDLTEKTDKREFLLSLEGGEDGVWESFDARARNQVRKGQKSGLQAVLGGEELLDDFYRIFSRNMRDLGTPVWPRSLFSEIFRVFKNESQIALVTHENRPIAGALVLHYAGTSAVPSASSYREYRSLCPNNALYWEVIRACIGRGSRLFDFGRSTRGSGTYHFKKQWVREPRPQTWQYRLLTIDRLPELNPNNPRFKLAIAVWKRLPLGVANFIGPKIVTKLP